MICRNPADNFNFLDINGRTMIIWPYSEAENGRTQKRNK